MLDFNHLEAHQYYQDYRRFEQRIAGSENCYADNEGDLVMVGVGVEIVNHTQEKTGEDGLD